ncbi:hypothetical protein CO659_00165 [Rhizobium sp. S9]|uniref:hypothetical protein n=1 Tax=Rhizobium sp. S9 TaxID=2035454 RepID=UPI000BEA41DB|nr:hypothetical protein [Rhizobium sp. S9]PDS99269.1 hypothetical protein CO659_00165 [Rhizobium sp. S9]
MSRFNETETALIERLRALKAAPDMSIPLFDIGVPMNAAGFSQEEIMPALHALEQEKIITFIPGKRALPVPSSSVEVVHQRV